MTEKENELYIQLVNKSQEAFVMAIEIYNKPTLKYRVEGFAFFVCNAWELMLKAKIIKDKGESAIYYEGKESRTLNLERCIRLVFTNEKDPLRKNLERIYDLRNTSTHFITQEYEMLYVSLFQACAYNYADKLLQFHGVNITDVVPAHFINLTISQLPLNLEEVKARYSPEIFSKLSKTEEFIRQSTDEMGSDRFAISIKQDLKLVKSKDPNVPGFRIIKAGEPLDGNVMIVNKYKNINETHPLTIKRLLEVVQKRFSSLGITLNINKSNIQDFIKHFELKDKERFCYTNTIGSSPTYSYSMDTAELIVSEVQKDRDVFKSIHETLKNTAKEKK